MYLIWTHILAQTEFVSPLNLNQMRLKLFLVQYDVKSTDKIDETLISMYFIWTHALAQTDPVLSLDLNQMDLRLFLIQYDFNKPTPRAAVLLRRGLKL